MRATTLAVLLAGLALLLSAALVACGPPRETFISPASTTTTTYSRDCRLGPADCGYGDNGRNGDR